MARSPQHELLAQGAEIWNQWRRKRPRVVPRLSRNHLVRWDLGGADLHGAQLYEVCWNQTNLHSAFFRSAQLTTVEFQAVDLRGADFKSADVRFSSFSGANLSGADLRNSSLNRTLL